MDSGSGRAGLIRLAEQMKCDGQAGMDTITLDDLRPQLVCQVMDEEFGTLGYLVIDRTIGANACGGGIRLAPGLTVEEIAQLARVMTLKFSFLNFAIGGAKAGITVSPELIARHRQRVVAAFGRSLGILIKRKVYFMGEDLGTTLEDINVIQQVLGNPPYASNLESIRHTALTVFEVIKRTVAHRRLRFSALTAAIEGFGKVGSELAAMLAGAGAKIVAVSTEVGAIHDPAGLDVTRMLSLREQHGDGFVKHYPRAGKIEKPELLTLSVDLLIPCARTWTINSANATDVRAGIIVPAANAPVTPAAEKMLGANGVLYMPDFVANSGAILASRMGSFGLGAEDVTRAVEEVFGGKVTRVLELADKHAIMPAELARAVAWRNFQRMGERSRLVPGNAANGALHRGLRGIWRRARRGIVFGSNAEHNRRRVPFAQFVQDFIGEIDVPAARH